MSEKEQDKGISKKSLIVIKGQELTKSDYRGFLALILVLTFAYVVVSGASCSAIAALGPLTGSAITYYFQSKPLNGGHA